MTTDAKVSDEVLAVCDEIAKDSLKVARELLAYRKAAGKPVAWMSPGKERLEFSRPDTVYGSHTIPLYAAPPSDGRVSVPREFLERCKRKHYYCEDTWYSCPKEPEEGCANENAGTDCNCGADEWNAEVNALIEAAEKEGE